MLSAEVFAWLDPRVPAILCARPLERKPEIPGEPPAKPLGEPSRDDLRAALLRLAVAHNRAILAGTTIALGAALGLCGAGVALLGRSGVLGAAAIAAGLGVGWRGVRLQRHLVRDLGAGRAAGAEAAARMWGGARFTETVNPGPPRRDDPSGFTETVNLEGGSERGVAFLKALDLVREGADGRMVLDRRRIEPLLTQSA